MGSNQRIASLSLYLIQSKENEVDKIMAYYMKVVGVTYDNRQQLIEKLKPGDKLYFRPDPSNQYDNYAVQVVNAAGEQLGFVSKEQNRTIFENLINNNGMYDVSVSAVTGGGYGSNYGLNIEVEYINNYSFAETENSQCEYDISVIKKVSSIEEETQALGREYSSEIFDFICDVLTKNDIIYDTKKEDGKIFIFNNNIDSSLNKISFYLEIRMDDYTVYALPADFSILPENIMSVTELAMHINYRYLFPQFIMGYTDRTIACKYFCNVCQDNMDEEYVMDSLVTVLNHFETFGNCIVAVSLGLQSVEDALKSNNI